VGAIDACPSLAELGALGKRLYTLALTHEQASVAWSHFQLREIALEQAVTLRPTARAGRARRTALARAARRAALPAPAHARRVRLHH